MSSMSISCLAPKPPPMRGLITRMSLISRSIRGASIRRVWKGTCVAVRTTMRSSESSHATEMWFSIGTCCTWCTRYVISKTWSASANPASTSPRWASMWWTMLRSRSWMWVVSSSSWMTGAPRFHRLELVEDRRQDVVGDLDQAQGLVGDLRGLGGHSRHAVADVTDLRVEAHLVVRVRVGPALAARRVLHPWRVLVVEDGVHARATHSAAESSMSTMCACACGLRRTLPTSWPRSSKSSVKAGLPFTRRTASTLTSGFPTTAISGTSLEGTSRGTALEASGRGSAGSTSTAFVPSVMGGRINGPNGFGLLAPHQRSGERRIASTGLV